MNIITKLLLITLLSTATLFAALLPVPFADNFCDKPTLNIPKTECEALEALWNSTGGENWTYTDGWGVDTNVANWDGISITDDNASVFRIGLQSINGEYPRGNNLKGELPNNLDNLTRLGQLVLSNNHLSGNIPTSLKNITTLTIFAIGDNNYSGALPKLIGLDNLEHLSLYKNNFTGTIPKEYNQLPKLKSLRLYSNHLSGAIPDLSALPLETFEIYFNNFTFSNIEPQIDWMEKVTVLNYRNQYDINETGRIVYFDDVLTIKPRLAINPSGNDNYTWIKGNDEENVLSTERIYEKHGATIADEGYYNYEVNNTILTKPSVDEHSTNAYLRSSGHPSSHPFFTGTSLYAKHDNSPKVSNPTPPLTGTEGVAYTYTSEVNDSDVADELNITLSTTATWLELEGSTNGTLALGSNHGSFTLSGTPDYTMAGTYEVNLTITDSKIPKLIHYTLTVAQGLPSVFSTSNGTFSHDTSHSSIIADGTYPNVEDDNKSIELHSQASVTRAAYERLDTSGALTTGFYNNQPGTSPTPTLSNAYPAGSKASILPKPNSSNEDMIMVEIPLTSSITIGD